MISFATETLETKSRIWMEISCIKMQKENLLQCELNYVRKDLRHLLFAKMLN